MLYIPPETVSKAREMDLLTYLRNYEPDELVHFGGSAYCTREHDSLKISNGKWCWFSRGIGGTSALDYLIKVKDVPFLEAVERITGQAAVQPPVFVSRPGGSTKASHTTMWCLSEWIVLARPGMPTCAVSVRTSSATPTAAISGTPLESLPLGKVVIYVENPDKTSNPAFVKQPELTADQMQGLSDVIDYATNSEKTQAVDEQSEVLRSFVSGVNCHPSTARDEMIAVKKRFGKEDGTVAYHGYQSFAPGEATPELAHEIGLKLSQRLWGERYQVLVTTHLGKENHLHNHFVLNTVSFVDGIKYHRTAQDYRDMQAASDALCREYGLSVIADPQPGKSKHYGEWRAEQEQRPTWRGIVRADVDEAIRQSMTERQFFDYLRKDGYEIKISKDISVRPTGKERFVRLMRNFGEEYSMEGIRKRILEQSRAARPLAEPPKKSQQYHFSGKLKSTKKNTGFRSLYFHYCYLLGIFPRGKPKSNKRLHFLLREDLLKLDAISQEAKPLAANRIDTAQQLVSYKEGLEVKMLTLTDHRKELYRSQRTTKVKSDSKKREAISSEISSISKQLSQLRREEKLCDDIAIRSGVMREKTQAVRSNSRPDRKERCDRRKCTKFESLAAVTPKFASEFPEI